MTLPASWYSDPAVLALERERIFGRSWQYVGVAADVAEPANLHVLVFEPDCPERTRTYVDGFWAPETRTR